MRRLEVVLTVALAAAPCAQADDKRPYAIDVSTTAGYRMADIDGAKNRYQEDVNLRSGGRLFGFELNGMARAPEKTLLDRFQLLVGSPHDEPASHYRLVARDRERWDLTADFTRAKYLYAVPQLWEQPVASNRRIDDLHDFDLDRTNGRVDLTLRLPALPTLRLGYRLYERRGDSVTSVSQPDGGVTLLRLPVDSIAHVGQVGTDFRVFGTDVSLTQAYRRVERTIDRTGPLGSDNLTPGGTGDGFTAFGSRQDEHIGMPATTVRLRRPLGDRAEITGAYFFSHADLDVTRLRLRTRTGSLAGSDRVYDRADAVLDTHVVDLGASWHVDDRATLHLTYRLNDRSQNGQLDTLGLGTPLSVATGHHVRVHRITADAELTPHPDLRLRLGGTYARRDARFTLTGDRVATDVVSGVADVRWQPKSWLDTWLRYRNEQIDDPLASAGDPLDIPPRPAREITLTFANRGTAGVRLRPLDWLSIRYELIAESRENASFDARSERFGNSVSVSLTPGTAFAATVGYTRRDVDTRADIFVTGRPSAVRSIQHGTEDVVTAELDWRFKLLGQSWSTIASLSWVDAATVVGPRLEPDLLGSTLFDLDRVDGSIGLTLHHRWIEPTVEFRMIDYNEPVLPRNDYRATIVTVKLTKRFAL